MASHSRSSIRYGSGYAFPSRERRYRAGTFWAAPAL